MQVIAAAVSILETANASASLSALVGLTNELFDVEWSALVNLSSGTYVECVGDVPTLEWLVSFVSARRTTGPLADTTGSGVMAGELTETGLILCVGRAVAFRRRERARARHAGAGGRTACAAPCGATGSPAAGTAGPGSPAPEAEAGARPRRPAPVGPRPRGPIAGTEPVLVD